MRSSSRSYSASLRSLFAALLVTLALALPARAYFDLPRQVRVLPDQEYRLPNGFWFRAATPRAKEPGALQARVFVDRILVSGETGEVHLEWRFLGLIPVGSLRVETVPEVSVVPGGQAIGVLMNAQGLLVTRTTPVTDASGRRRHPAAEAGVQPGDVLAEVNGEKPESPQHVSRLIQEAGRRGVPVRVVLMRGKEQYRTELQPVPVFDSRSGHQRYMVGLYLQDPVAGVGTLTFYHPVTGRYGALGHVVTDATREPLQFTNGQIVRAVIRGVQRGAKGRPGEKIGAFDYGDARLGTIEKNNQYGIFGRLHRPPDPSPFGEPIPVALAHEVKVGPAKMLTVLDGDQVEAFDVEIVRVFPRGRQDGRGMIVRIVDPRLLARTEGIVQGMSGSPIIQDGRLVGAVTHVFVNDPARGYGTMAEWMVYEAGIPLPRREEEARPEAS